MTTTQTQPSPASLGWPAGSEKSRQRVLLVDDHPFFLRALRTLIDQEPDMMVCGTADGSAGLLEKITALTPAVVVLDVHLRSEDGIVLAGVVRAAFRELPIVFLTSCQAAEVRSRARQLGAAVIEKTQAPAGILSELRAAIAAAEARKQSKLVS